MTDYKKLVNALRCCATMTCKGDECKYMILGCHDCFPKLHDDAADAIEALEKQIDSIENDKTNLEADIINLEIALDKAKTQLPKRGEWITIRLNNGGSYTGCSCCEAPIPTDTMLDYIHESESKYCYSCGAKMTEAQDG